EFAYQTLDQAPEGRTKPLGTGHALLSAASHVSSPFAAINADDFYGASSFRMLAQSLSGISNSSGVLVGFELENTLSDYGTVSRAVCERSTDHVLTRIEEHTQVGRGPEGITGYFQGSRHSLRQDTIVSLNLWGFSLDFMEFLKIQFEEFLANIQDPIKEEFYLPTAVFNWIQKKGAAVELKVSHERWLGLTNPQDKVDAVAQLMDRIARGEYPSNLWA
ncbi:MAG: nucleotidyltransferase, partial [Verrucomicrobiae bacterium]|nr:nucleotidyltransferase [Verrucomicrobiae bacterium]